MNNQPETDEKAFFQKRFENFDSQPDDKVWAAIQQKMESPAPKLIFWPPPRFLSLLTVGLLLTGYLSWQWSAQTAWQPENASGTHRAAVDTSVPISHLPVVTPEVVSASTVTDSDKRQESELPAYTPVPTSVPDTQPAGYVSSVHPAQTRRTSKRLPVSVNPETDNGNMPESLAVVESPKGNNTTHLSRKKTSGQSRIENPNQEMQEPAYTTPIHTDNRKLHPPLYQKEYALLSIRTIRMAHLLPKVRTLTFQHTPAVKIQPEIEPIAKKRRLSGSWRLFGSGTHFMNYYAVSPIQSDAVFVQSLESPPALSSQRSSWQLQGGVEYAFAPRWSIRGAVFYAYQKQVISYRLQHASTDISAIENPSPEEVVITRTEASSSRDQFSRLQKQMGLQAAVLYELPANPSFSHYLVSGMQGGWTRKNEYTSSLQTDVHIGYGIRRPFTPQLAFWIEPSFRYSLQSIENPVIRIRPYYFGISAGLSFQVSH